MSLASPASLALDVPNALEVPDALHVYLPHGGRRFLLHWWTDSDRGHLVVARSEPSLLLAAKRILTEGDGALGRAMGLSFVGTYSVRGVYEIELVAPPSRLVRDVAALQRAEGINAFLWEVCGRVADAIKIGPVPGFKACKRYRPTDGRKPSAASARDRESHFMCGSCRFGVVLDGMTPDVLYDRFHDAWKREVKPREVHVTPIAARGLPLRARSRARQATDDEKVSAVLCDFTDHGQGAFLTVPDAGDLVRHRSLFFFTTTRTLDDSPFVALVKAAKETYEVEKEKSGEQSKRKHEDLLRAQAEATQAFFTRHAASFTRHAASFPRHAARTKKV